MTPHVLTVLGLALELGGVVLGLFEIYSSRRAAVGFIKRARHVYVSAHVKNETVVSARPTTNDPMVPTISDRVDDLDARVKRLDARIDALPKELEEAWREHTTAVIRSHEAGHRDLETALNSFAEDLGAGLWRRVLTVGLLVSGGVLQVLGVLLTT